MSVDQCQGNCHLSAR